MKPKSQPKLPTQGGLFADVIAEMFKPESSISLAEDKKEELRRNREKKDT